jgi:hypothetical protein
MSSKKIDAAYDVTQAGKHYTNRLVTGGPTVSISVPTSEDFAAWVREVEDAFGSSGKVHSNPLLKRYQRWGDRRLEGWAGFYIDHYQSYYDRLQQLTLSYDSVRVGQAAHGSKMATCLSRLLKTVDDVRKIDQALYKQAGLGDNAGLPL